MVVTEVTARDRQGSPVELGNRLFSAVLTGEEKADGVYFDASEDTVLVVANLPIVAPIAVYLLRVPGLAQFFVGYLQQNKSVLISFEGSHKLPGLFHHCDGQVFPLHMDPKLLAKLHEILCSTTKWAGTLNQRGELTIDLRSPLPGTHYGVNLLLGNRVGYPHALQSTPKSVVDFLGRGSFRSHADTQVLATRWDLLPEENGFPANRQFYLVEDQKCIFYSASPNSPHITKAYCVHSQNKTTIYYYTSCGLEIKRTIFLLPQEEGLPLATEVQIISITNTGTSKRNLKLVYTGMFGAHNPGGLQEDVLYTALIMQSKILKLKDRSLGAISYEYNPQYAQGNVRFHASMLWQNNQVSFPQEFSTSFRDFVGSGSLTDPQGVAQLGNSHSRKGPGFFGLASHISLAPGDSAAHHNFTGLVSNVVNPEFNEETFRQEVGNLLARFSKVGELQKFLAKVERFQEKFTNYMQIQSGDRNFDAYVNHNLPFQVLYQTFVSRSFAWTQKGYREIGFREIQDIYASMYYFVAMDLAEYAKQLLMEWARKVFEFGYTYHNFYWQGKEAGKWSDDGLWFVQAVERYVDLTDDTEFLQEECEIAGSEPTKTRSIMDTIKAILIYSGKVSVGIHGLPLLDKADWNDTMQIEPDYLDGPEKEELCQAGSKIPQHFAESVMNGFLLKRAIDAAWLMATRLADDSYAKHVRKDSNQLLEQIQTHTWKEDFFARVLFNRFAERGISYMGGKGDGFSADPNLTGTYFLNSFTWSILSDCATEEQIATMLATMEKTLKTPHGMIVCSRTDFGKVSDNAASGHYHFGDRENGAVFKHADMMATAAMFKAAKEVKDPKLAAKLSETAYWIIDQVLPYNTLQEPYITAGNPRFCTQYTNSETGEHIGPILSGTSSWLLLSLMSAFGLDFSTKGIELNPILKKEQTSFRLTLNTGGAVYRIDMKKPQDFRRVKDGKVSIKVDGLLQESNTIPLYTDGKEHSVEVCFG